jgi:hypothetical protein
MDFYPSVQQQQLTNLLESTNDWSLALKNRNSVDVAYIDYSKAFDTVCKTKLCGKLSSYGISGSRLRWRYKIFLLVALSVRV